MSPLTRWKVSLGDRHLHISALTYFHWITSFPSVSLDGETQLAQLAGRPIPDRAAVAATDCALCSRNVTGTMVQDGARRCQ